VIYCYFLTFDTCICTLSFSTFGVLYRKREFPVFSVAFFTQSTKDSFFAFFTVHRLWSYLPLVAFGSSNGLHSQFLGCHSCDLLDLNQL